MKYQAINTIKLIVGAMLAILIASALGLDYALSSGVIAMLSILQTKRESIVSGFKRFMAAILAVFLAGVLFYLVGFEIWVLAFFLLLFIPMTIFLDLERVMIPSVVLVTHIYADGMLTVGAMLNEVYLMAIGVLIALLMNLYMPNYEKEIKLFQKKTETLMIRLLRTMAEHILDEQKQDERLAMLKELKETINGGRDLSYQYMNNSLLKDNSYYASYFTMRKAQYIRLKEMQKYFGHKTAAVDEAYVVKAFLLRVSDEFHESNTGQQLLSELADIREKYKSHPLPETREAFEHRAILYQFLNDIGHFIEIKSDFAESLS